MTNKRGINRGAVIPAVLTLLFSVGCSGVSPIVLDAHDQASRAATIYHLSIRANHRALLADLHATMLDYAADLAEASMDAAAEDGAIMTPRAQAVLAEYIKRIQAVRAKMASMAAKLEANEASREEFAELQAGIRRILVQLVRRRQAEDRLQAVGVEAAKRGAQAAKRAAIGQ